MEENHITLDNIAEKMSEIEYFLSLVFRNFDKRFENCDEFSLFKAWLASGDGSAFYHKFTTLNFEFKTLLQTNRTPSIYQGYRFAFYQDRKLRTKPKVFKTIIEAEEPDTEIDEDNEDYRTTSVRDFATLFKEHPEIKQFFIKNFTFFSQLNTAWQTNYEKIKSFEFRSYKK